VCIRSVFTDENDLVPINAWFHQERLSARGKCAIAESTQIILRFEVRRDMKLMLANCRQSPRATSVGFLFQLTNAVEVARVLLIGILTVQLGDTLQHMLSEFRFWGGDPALALIVVVVLDKHHGRSRA
jgi:hypothetical protein